MSDSDESNFGALLFGDEANEVAPEYPIESLTVDRAELANEGATNEGFSPLYDRFDTPADPPSVIAQSAVREDEKGAVAVTAQQLRERGAARMGALQSAPLVVHYRNKHHSLWGHRLWNAAKYLAKRMDQRCIDVRGKTVLELGAGLGVPSLVAYRNGAATVVVTDYPDADLLDIIKLNVEENCKPGLIDGDVRGVESTSAHDSGAAEPRCIVEPLLWGKQEHIQKALQYTGGIGFDVVILSDILFNHVCNDDLVSTLAQTLSSRPSAAGYCVFSHHRAYKQLQDFEFFDKCVAQGLRYEQIDEENYPLMFPEDRGPEAVRMPVKCYRICRRYDRVGAPLDTAAVLAGPSASSTTSSRVDGGKPSFDAIVLGTGLTQSLLSAALARSGLKVLHCGAESQYGGAHATLGLREFVAYLERLKANGTQASEAKFANERRCVQQRHGQSLPAARQYVPGTESPCIVVPATSADGPATERYLIDLVPAAYMASGDLIQQLVRSDMVRTIEFQHLTGFFFLSWPGPQTGVGSAGAAELESVPLTRGSVFSASQIGLLDKRRLMKFVKDVEASLAEQLHAKSASSADSVELQRAAAAAAAAQATELFAKETERQPDLTLTQLLAQKYGLKGHVLDVISLMGELNSQRTESSGGSTGTQSGLLRSVQMVRQLLTSVGAYGGSTPFIVPSYGASELPQSTCRTSAVWGSVFMLQRGLSRIYLDEEKEVQYAVLTNGQHIPARVIVAPQELLRPGACSGRPALALRRAGWKSVLTLEQQRAAGTLEEGLSGDDLRSLGGDASDHCGGVPERCLSRVVLIARRPLITAAAAAQAAHPSAKGCAVAASGDDAAPAAAAQPPLPPPPVVMALMRTESGAVVHLVQQSTASDQVLPRGSSHVILHFTASSAALSQAALQQFVEASFLTSRCSQQAGSGEGEAAEEQADQPLPAAAVARLSMATDVVLLAGFTLSSTQLALDSIYGDRVGEGAASTQSTGHGTPDDVVDVPSETRFSDAFAIGECEKLQQATESDRRRVLHEEHCSSNSSEPAAPASKADYYSSPLLKLVGVPTLAGDSLLHDGAYVDSAHAAYDRVVDLILSGVESSSEREKERAAFTFLERLPPPPQPTVLPS